MLYCSDPETKGSQGHCPASFTSQFPRKVGRHNLRERKVDNVLQLLNEQRRLYNDLSTHQRDIDSIQTLTLDLVSVHITVSSYNFIELDRSPFETHQPDFVQQDSLEFGLQFYNFFSHPVEIR